MADQREPLFSLPVPKLKTGLKEHKNNLRRQQSAPWQCFAETISGNPSPCCSATGWNRDDKSVTDYAPLHPHNTSRAACRGDVLALLFKGFQVKQTANISGGGSLVLWHLILPQLSLGDV